MSCINIQSARAEHHSGSMELPLTVILMLTVCGINAIPTSNVTKNATIKKAPTNNKDVVESSRTLGEDEESVSPECTDFYSFACEAVQNKYHIPENRAKWSFFDVVKNSLDLKFQEMLEETPNMGDTLTVQMAKRAYQSCVNEDVANTRGVRALRAFLDDLGGWNIFQLGINSNEDTDMERAAFLMQWTRLIYKLTQQFTTESNVFPLIQISVVPNPNNTTQNILKIAPAATVLPEKMLQNAMKYRPQVTAYIEYIANVAGILSHEHGMRTSFEDIFIHQGVEKIVKLEIKLAKLLEHSHDEEDEIKTIKSGPDQHDLDWDKIFSEIAGPEFQGEVLIENPSYFRHLKTLIEQEKSDTLSMYMIWKVVHHLVPFSSDDVRNAELDFKKAMSGVQDLTPRSQVCASDVSEAVPYAMLHAYVDQLPNYSRTVTVGHRAVRAILSEVSKHLANWSGGESQLDPSKVSVYLGAPRWLLIQGMVDIFYKEIYAETADNYIHYHLTMQRFKALKALKTLQQTNKGKAWNLEANKFMLSYDPRHKILSIPITMMRGPFFDLDQFQPANSVKFDTIVSAMIIQGEMASHVENTEDLNSLWFHDALGCHVNKLKSYGVTPLPTQYGVLGLGNLVVSAAMNVAQSLDKQRHTATETLARVSPPYNTSDHSKNFYVAFATLWCENTRPAKESLDASLGVHAPHRLRVISTLANSRQFSDTWSCPENSTLNPPDKCELHSSVDLAQSRGDFCLENRSFFFSFSLGAGLEFNKNNGTNNSTSEKCSSHDLHKPKMTSEVKEFLDTHTIYLDEDDLTPVKIK